MLPTRTWKCNAGLIFIQWNFVTCFRFHGFSSNVYNTFEKLSSLELWKSKIILIEYLDTNKWQFINMNASCMLYNVTIHASKSTIWYIILCNIMPYNEALLRKEATYIYSSSKSMVNVTRNVCIQMENDCNYANYMSFCQRFPRPILESINWILIFLQNKKKICTKTSQLNHSINNHIRTTKIEYEKLTKHNVKLFV